jgi:hypothetical protein
MALFTNVPHLVLRRDTGNARHRLNDASISFLDKTSPVGDVKNCQDLTFFGKGMRHQAERSRLSQA